MNALSRQRQGIIGTAIGKGSLEVRMVSGDVIGKPQHITLGLQQGRGRPFAKAGDFATQIASRGTGVQPGPQQVTQPFAPDPAIQAQQQRQELALADGRLQNDGPPVQVRRDDQLDRCYEVIMPATLPKIEWRGQGSFLCARVPQTRVCPTTHSRGWPGYVHP